MQGECHMMFLQNCKGLLLGLYYCMVPVFRGERVQGSRNSAVLGEQVGMVQLLQLG